MPLGRHEIMSRTSPSSTRGSYPVIPKTGCRDAPSRPLATPDNTSGKTWFVIDGTSTPTRFVLFCASEPAIRFGT